MSKYGKLEILDDLFKILISEKRENNVKLVGKRIMKEKEKRTGKKQKKNKKKKKMGRHSFGRAV